MEELAFPFMENLVHSQYFVVPSHLPGKKWTLSARGGGAACSVCSAGYDWKYLHILFLFLEH